MSNDKWKMAVSNDKWKMERSHANVSVHMAPEKLAEPKLSFPFVIFQISKLALAFARR
jgi:hypothetical protein